VITAVADASQVSEARRLVSAYARRGGMAEARIGEVAVVVTELATNLLKHAVEGQILASMFDDAEGSGLEVLALDRGRGMNDVSRCIDDGYSTAGSPGNGLGAITRIADDMRIYSRSGLGTAVQVRFLTKSAPGAFTSLIGAAVAPYPGELVSGDAWAFSEPAEGTTVMLADGAGHGIEAARAAETAVKTFLANANEPCVEVVEQMHRAMMPTRGGAVAVARFDAAARKLRYVGVGNIAAILVCDGVARHLVSHNGTAGHLTPRIREFTYDFTGNPLVILHSDGLTSRWDLSAYPGLASQHPSLIAGILLRDHRRGRDDASVVAIRPML
jgi:anti-sigma regulatory factor (Ser/Thr protein kinase)